MFFVSVLLFPLSKYVGEKLHDVVVDWSHAFCLFLFFSCKEPLQLVLIDKQHAVTDDDDAAADAFVEAIGPRMLCRRRRTASIWCNTSNTPQPTAPSCI